MESLLLELKNLISNYTNKPNFIFLKAFCLITWAAFVFKLTVIPIWLVIIPFCLIFLANFLVSYVKIAKSYNAQLKKQQEQKVDEIKENTISATDITNNDTISTNI